MNLLYQNINANFRIVLDFGMEVNHAKKIVARLAGKVIIAIIDNGTSVIIKYTEHGLAGKTVFNKILTPVVDDYTCVYVNVA